MTTRFETNRRANICVVGSVNIDLLFRSPRFPQPGETLTGNSFTQCMGGKGANQAVAAARLGADVTLIACVGNDSMGTAAIEHFRTEGIHTELIHTMRDQSTGTAAIVVDDRAENCIIVVPGANALLSLDHVRQAAECIAASDAVVCQLETPIDATLEAFRIARKAGKKTILTPAPIRDLPDELLQLCDLCIPNRTEMETLSKRSITSSLEAEEAMTTLICRGVGAVALTLGSDGACISERGATVTIPAVKVNAVDTTGAGDAFSAALAVMLSEGIPLTESARYAVQVAAISVTRAGTQPSFPFRKETSLPRLHS